MSKQNIYLSDGSTETATINIQSGKNTGKIQKYQKCESKVNPAGIYPLKVNNRNNRTRCEIFSLKTPDANGVVLVSLLLTFNIFHTLF